MRKAYSSLCFLCIVAMVFCGCGFLNSDVKKSYVASIEGLSSWINVFGSACSKVVTAGFDLADRTADNFYDGISTIYMPDFYEDAKHNFSKETPEKESLSDVVALWYSVNGYLDIENYDTYKISGKLPNSVIETIYLSDMHGYCYKEQTQLYFCIESEIGALHKPAFYFSWWFLEYPYGADKYLPLLTEAVASGKKIYTDGWMNHMSELFLDSNGNPYYSSP